MNTDLIIAIASFFVTLIVTFLLGSSDPVITNGERFADVFWLKATDMFIYTSILLLIGCFVSAIIGRFRS